jgi:hypothetical protein
MFDSEAWLRQRGRRVPHTTPARFPGAALIAPATDQEDDPVGQKTVRFSDLSGQLITGDEAPARIVIREHPALAGGPVEIEALTGEARDIEKAAAQAAVLDLYFPGDDQPRRVAMDATAFDSAATEAPMEQILASARPPRRAPRSRAATDRAAAGPAATEPTGTEPAAVARTGASEK